MQFVEEPRGGAAVGPDAGVGPGSVDQVRIWLYGAGWVDRPSDVLSREGSSWAWTEIRGWFGFEDPRTEPTPSAYTDYDLPNEADDMWRSYNPTTRNHREEAWPQRPWRPREDDRRKDGNVPEWDGKSTERSVYFRKIDLWRATTGVKPEEQGIRN